MVGSGIKSIAQFTFKSLYETQPLTGQPRLAEVACWAHARRKIYLKVFYSPREVRPPTGTGTIDSRCRSAQRDAKSPQQGGNSPTPLRCRVRCPRLLNRWEEWSAAELFCPLSQVAWPHLDWLPPSRRPKKSRSMQTWVPILSITT